MAKKTEVDQVLKISAPNFKTSSFKIEGTAPYCQNAFSAKAKAQMISDQEKGGAKKASSKRPPKDFDKNYREAMHISDDGWNGIPASAFRNAMISACRAANVVMTRAKLAIFIEPDGFDKVGDEPLVKIIKGKPKRQDAPVRLPNGSIDIRPRPVWKAGWQAMVTIRWDQDMIEAIAVANLLQRAGLQVGIGEGRPDSKKSAGIGYGFFKLLNK